MRRTQASYGKMVTGLKAYSSSVWAPTTKRQRWLSTHDIKVMKAYATLLNGRGGPHFGIVSDILGLPR